MFGPDYLAVSVLANIHVVFFPCPKLHFHPNISGPVPEIPLHSHVTVQAVKCLSSPQFALFTVIPQRLNLEGPEQNVKCLSGAATNLVWPRLTFRQGDPRQVAGGVSKNRAQATASNFAAPPNHRQAPMYKCTDPTFRAQPH